MTTLHQSHEDISPTQLDNQPEKIRWRDRLRKGIGAKAAAIAATGAALISFNACAASSHEVSAMPEHTTTSAPAHPSSSKASAETSPSAHETSQSQPEFTRENLEIPADLDPQGVGEAFWQRMSWTASAGGTADTAKLWWGDDPSKYNAIDRDKRDLYPIADKNATLFADSVFEKGWEDNPNLVQTRNGIKKTDEQDLELYVLTAPEAGDPGDVEPYKRTMELDGDVTVVSQDTNTATIKTTVVEHDNHDKNRADYFTDNGVNIDGNTFDVQITYKKAGDHFVITDAVWM